MTLQCGSQQRFYKFVLINEKENLSWTQVSWQGPSGEAQALITLGPVTPKHRWWFRCYGYNSNKPQAWSESSNSLELLIPGEKVLSSATAFDSPNTLTELKINGHHAGSGSEQVLNWTLSVTDKVTHREGQ